MQIVVFSRVVIVTDHGISMLFFIIIYVVYLIEH